MECNTLYNSVATQRDVLCQKNSNLLFSAQGKTAKYLSCQIISLESVHSLRHSTAGRGLTQQLIPSQTYNDMLLQHHQTNKR